MLVEIENIIAAIFLLDQKIDSEEFVKRAAFVATEFQNLQEEHKLRLTDWIDYTIAEPVREGVIEMLRSKLSRKEVDDMTANINITLQEEKERAIREGREEGRREEKYALVRNLLDILEDDVIASRVGLPIEEIKRLRNE